MPGNLTFFMLSLNCNWHLLLSSPMFKFVHTNMCGSMADVNYGGNSCLQVKAFLGEGKDIRLGDWKAADIEVLNSFQLLTAKPVVYLVTSFTFSLFLFD